MKIVVDSDAIYALYNPHDPLHKRAVLTFQKLTDCDCQIVYPTSVIFEVISLFQRVSPQKETVQHLVEQIQSDQLITYMIDEETFKDAVKLFKPEGSKYNTLIDCSVVAVAKKIKADGIFSYDSFYTKQGLKQAEKIL